MESNNKNRTVAVLPGRQTGRAEAVRRMAEEAERKQGRPFAPKEATRVRQRMYHAQLDDFIAQQSAPDAPWRKAPVTVVGGDPQRPWQGKLVSRASGYLPTRGGRLPPVAAKHLCKPVVSKSI